MWISRDATGAVRTADIQPCRQRLTNVGASPIISTYQAMSLALSTS